MPHNKRNFQSILGQSLIGILFFISQNLYAAPAVTIPGSAQPDRAAQTLQIPLGIAPKSMGALNIPETSEPRLSKAAANIRFRLSGVVIQGNTVYPQADLYWLFRNYLNTEVTLANLETIAHEITLKYRNNGYVLSRAFIPPQQVTNGIVVVRVVEGYVDKVAVEGEAKANTKALVQAYGNRVIDSGPLNIRTLERYVLLANDLPGVQARAILRPSAVNPGAANLIFVLQEKRGDAYANINNRGTLLIGPEQYMVGGSINNSLRAGDSTDVRVAGAFPTKELKFYEIAHQQQLGTDGARLQVSANYTRSRPGSYLSSFDIDGTSTSFTGMVSLPFLRTRDENVFVDTGLKYSHSKTNILTNQILFKDTIYSFLLGANYDVTDNLRGVNYISAHVTQGLPILNASKNNSATASRAGARNDFTKVNVDASRIQTLTQRFSLALMARSQYSFSSLYSLEQFGVGGTPIGGAYDPSEIMGDRGLAGKIELRYLQPTTITMLPNLQFYTYYDAGKIWNKNSLNQPASQSLTSAGLGVRLQFIKYLEGSFEVAKPLTRAVAIETSDGRNGKAPRVFFSVSGKL